MIKANNVEKIYPNGVHALKGVSLEVAKSEVLVIIGPSGSGKSTILRSLNLLEEIQSGEILIEGVSLTSKKKANINKIRAEVGMVFQSFNLFPHKTVLQNITMAPIHVKRMKKDRS